MIAASCRDEVNGHWVDTADGRLYVEVSGDGTPVLLIHGWSLDHRSFAPQIPALSRCFRVISYDRRGFGRSEAPPGLGREVDDIERILDAFDVVDAHILGVSQGGRISLRFALTHPARTRSLVLQGAMIDGLDVQETGEERIPLEDYILLAREGRLDELRERWLAHPMMRLRGVDEGGRALIAEILADYDARDLLDHDPQGYSFDIDPLMAIRDFHKPLLLVTGAGETPARKEHARRLLDQAPSGDELVMPDSGHLSNLEESESFNDALINFLDGADRRGG